MGRRVPEIFSYIPASILMVGGILFHASGVCAHGWGVHVAGGLGDHSHKQVGLSWDTTVAEDRLFNYRMNLGYEWFELDESYGAREKFSGVFLENTFGFRLFANEGMRLWWGPQTVMGIYDAEIGFGLGLSLGANLHVSETSTIGITFGARSMEYNGLLGGTEREKVGYLRLDFFYRLVRDRFRKP
jgi:hypothetical protein